MLINHEITYYTGVRALVPRCPPFQRSWGSVPVLNPRSGIPGYNHFAPPPENISLVRPWLLSKVKSQFAV